MDPAAPERSDDATPPEFRLARESGGAVARIAGDWHIPTLQGEVAERAQALRLREIAAVAGPVVFDFSRLGSLDTAGALVFHRLIAAVPAGSATISGLGTKEAVLLAEIAGADRPPPSPVLGPGPVIGFVRDVGRVGVGLSESARSVLTLLGGAALVVGVAVRHPSRIRFIPFVHQFQRTAIDAVPIIALMSFLIGCIIAQQGAFYFRRFGADLYVVDMVGVLTLREIAVILTAVMVAGRSGSAFTAELGSMRMREEVDALKVIGLDPIEVLVVPRLFALMLALPILTFVADVAAVFGAAIVCNAYAGIPTETFLQRFHYAVELRTFLVGVSKAPFMAMIIGLVACSEGLAVGGSAESLGQRTTISVVKSIFMVIVVDGIFAMFYAAAGV